MDKVTVKTKNADYEGFIRGHRFYRGEAEMSLQEAEALKEFGVEIVKPEAPVIEEEVKPKRSPRKKKGE